MKIASVAYPVAAIVAAALALGVTAAIPRSHRVEPLAVAQAVDPPDDAPYFAIDLDGDGVPELVAQTADRANAVIVHEYRGRPIATIPLQMAGCQSELAVEDNQLIAIDHTGPDCHENQVRHFRLVGGRLIVDN